MKKESTLGHSHTCCDASPPKRVLRVTSPRTGALLSSTAMCSTDTSDQRVEAYPSSKQASPCPRRRRSEDKISFTTKFEINSFTCCRFRTVPYDTNKITTSVHSICAVQRLIYIFLFSTRRSKHKLIYELFTHICTTVQY